MENYIYRKFLGLKNGKILKAKIKHLFGTCRLLFRVINLHSISNNIIDYPILKLFELYVDLENPGVEKIRYQTAIVQTYISLSRK